MTDNLHPEGYYDAVVANVELKETQKEMLYFSFTLSTDAGIVRANIFLNENSSESQRISGEQLETLGFEDDDLAILARDPSLLSGNKVNILVVHSDCGKYANVKYINPIGGQQKDFNLEDKIGKLQRFNSILKPVEAPKF